MMNDEIKDRLQKRRSKFLKRTRHVRSKLYVPEFERNEIVIGKRVGAGGFNNVFEIKSFKPKKRSEVVRNVGGNDDNEINDEKNEYKKEENDERNAMIQDANNGKQRFVLKTIKQSRKKKNSNDNNYFQTAMDLIVEAHFMSALSHRHILKLRAISEGGTATAYYQHSAVDTFFLIFERLEETLDSRIKQWKRSQQQQQLRRIKKSIINAQFIEELYAPRLRVARDLSNALMYLHDHDIIYRDLKPSNVGFDRNGVLKLFDFGLSRGLPFHLDTTSSSDNSTTTTNNNGAYLMSPDIGTPRYISPEVYKGLAYNQSTDVYSLALVLWEMLALEKPFSNLKNRSAHVERVMYGGERPSLDNSFHWPYGIQVVIQRAWSQEWTKRPSMEEMHFQIIQEIDELKVSRNIEIVTSSSGYYKRKQRGSMEFTGVILAEIASKLPPTNDDFHYQEEEELQKDFKEEEEETTLSPSLAASSLSTMDEGWNKDMEENSRKPEQPFPNDMSFWIHVQH